MGIFNCTVLVIKGLLGHMRVDEVKKLLTCSTQPSCAALFKDTLHVSEWESLVTRALSGMLVGVPVPHPDHPKFTRDPTSFSISTSLGRRKVTLILGCSHCPCGGNHHEDDHRTFIWTLPHSKTRRCSCRQFTLTEAGPTLHVLASALAFRSFPSLIDLLSFLVPL